jgi:hypothetical protein
MVFFNFIETFFFISLGITFVLILLLVYHFKQRIVSLEQKCDTMFEIINNIVKEMNTLRNLCIRPPPNNPPPFLFQPEFLMRNMNNGISVPQPFQNQNRNIDVDLNNTNTDLNIDDDEQDDDSDDEDDDADSDDEDDNADDDDDADSDDEEEDDDDEDYTNMPPLISIDKSTIQLPIEIISEQLNDTEDIKIVNINKQPEIIEQVHIENLSDEIIQQTLNDVIEQVVDDSTEKTGEHENIDTKEQSAVEISKDVYRKMNIQSLKTLVITKGLCSDPSKLKKPELLKMLLDSFTE